MVGAGCHNNSTRKDGKRGEKCMRMHFAVCVLRVHAIGAGGARTKQDMHLRLRQFMYLAEVELPDAR